MTRRRRLLPTGECWDGCGEQTARGSFFLQGHDRRAETAVIKVEYGGVAEFLDAMGYAPGGKNPVKAFAEWQRTNK